MKEKLEWKYKIMILEIIKDGEQAKCSLDKNLSR